MNLKQIVISIENAPGRLFEVTNALGNAGINLRALNLVDTGAFGQLRLLVSDVGSARRILMKMQIPAFINEVVAAEIPDKPGSLASVLRPLIRCRNVLGLSIASITGTTTASLMRARSSILEGWMWMPSTTRDTPSRAARWITASMAVETISAWVV